MHNCCINFAWHLFSPLLENFLFSEFLKTGIVPDFWRSKSNAEVDFVWEMENRTIAVEAKSKLKRGAIPVSLKSFIEKYNPGKILLSTNLF
jgi:predicted AAA+ superfamily ATPase